MELLNSENAALAELRSWLEQRFRGRLAAVVLFGSRARGHAHEDSDVDVLVVVDELSSDEARAVRQHAGDLLTRHDVLVSLLALSTARYAHLRARERRIVREIERDGLPLMTRAS